VSNNFSKRSSKGQIPFIELNGLEIADSNIIIDFLENIYSKRLDEHLNDEQKADAHAYNALIEESIRWYDFLRIPMPTLSLVYYF